MKEAVCGGAVLAVALALASSAWSAAGQPGKGPTGGSAQQLQRTAPANLGSSSRPGPDPARQPVYPEPPSTVSQDAPARARMHECGHQWATMKKAGTTGNMTWKQFSATCLVVR